MSLVGKTIAREGDYGDTLYFTDGTSLHVTSDDGHWVRERGWAETQAALHAEQGQRERSRMRRLHDSLHSRDKQWLAQQSREAYQRRYQDASPMGKFMMDMELSVLGEMRATFLSLEQPKRRRKVRRS